jgi:hypothetical protein
MLTEKSLGLIKLCVVRDCQGKVLLSAWPTMENFASAEEAEAEACLQGIRLVRVWIGQPTIIEADCAGSIEEFMSEGQHRAPWAGVISEIHAVSRLLPEYRFAHVWREANGLPMH